VNEIFDDEKWDSARREENEVLDSETELPESVQWLNRFLASIWPLINPDLFASLIDTIEDVMQASLPKAIKMVSVDDMGQGNEAIRILGVRVLPTGAAAQSVDSNGHIIKENKDASSDRTDPSSGQEVTQDDEGKQGHQPQTKQQEEDKIAMQEGFEAEAGDFINLELALAYRSRSSGKSIRAKAKNAHLHLKFYLFGGTEIPIWVEV
jgi:Ca2+-dependent lipid-binding protein